MSGLDALGDLVAAVRGDRVIVGIAGAPGVGKSTATDALAARFPHAVVVPMDGFHLANEQLERLGRRDRKGAPDTFDAAGFVAAMERIRAREDVYLPRFDRSIEESIAGAIHVPASARLVIVEGNYLLLDTDPWSRLDAVFDARFQLEVGRDIRLARLTARHELFGMSPGAARAWAEGPDEANAVLIEAAAHRADAVVNI